MDKDPFLNFRDIINSDQLQGFVALFAFLSAATCMYRWFLPDPPENHSSTENSAVKKIDAKTQSYCGQLVPSCGLQDILLSTPNPHGKHINKQSLVTGFPIQRYCVQDLIQDIHYQENRIVELELTISKQEQTRQQQHLELQSLSKQLQEEEKTRVFAEHKAAKKKNEVERLRNDNSSSTQEESDLRSEISQLQFEILLLKEVLSCGYLSDEAQQKLQNLEQDVKHEEIQITNLQYYNDQLRKEKYSESATKDKLMNQLKLKRESIEMSNFFVEDKNHDRNEIEVNYSLTESNRSVYGFSIPTTYIRLENSVVNTPATFFLDESSPEINNLCVISDDDTEEFIHT